MFSGTVYFLLICYSCVFSVVICTSANYSVQLLEGMAPAGWSAKKWAAVADQMIGKTQAHIISDLIEDLGIKLQVAEQNVRESIGRDREKLSLGPLPPHDENFGPQRKFNVHSNKEPAKEEFASYLPPGWTEERFQNHRFEEYMELTQEVKSGIDERRRWELKILRDYPNPGYFQELPEDVKNEIVSSLHEATRQQAGLAPGVRAYKRAIAPIVQAVSVQNYDEFGFMLCRTSFSDEKLWEEAFERLNEIFEAQLDSESGFWGTELNLLEDKFLFPIEDDEKFEGATIDDCRKRFLELKSLDVIAPGIDVGVVLMADEQSLRALIDPSGEMPKLRAVDITFDPDKKVYPEGYKGSFEVVPAGLFHGLYVALGSGMMTPVDVWKLLEKPPTVEAAVKGHDEL